MSVDFWINVGVLAGIYGIFTLGLQLNAGFTGLLNFGQAGFMAIGAYSVGIFVVSWGLPLWLAFLLAVALAVAAGMLVGISALRLRSHHFAIATIGFAEIVRYTLQNAEFSGGNQGLIGFDDDWRSVNEWALSKLASVELDAYTQLPLLLAIWATFLVLLVTMELLQRTPWARVLRGIREDEDATAALGKNTFSYKLQSLGIAAALAAIAGFFVSLNITYLYPTVFDPTFTFFGYAILVLGGLGSYTGVALGSIIFWVLLEGTRLMETSLSAGQQSSLRFVIVGLSLILLSRLRPQGILGNRNELRAEP
ncbi:branched-chain amino acid ABC transporter permease [Mesorhizobium sp. YC-39]|uniref:branched-chain amino acid ABC transporter permease n=1 Tax=unclassified Mesorhizobium TaxID=325217 RepID=UPI0021E8BE78|nr:MULTISPECIES: branched-chain amino acid ABC transporter permease [unclassified Mesorhizobium]MCV3206107.1 branched-chain amino acid ABC transporter permease [Mesorhizobium sp. YC-2]MCV3227493.1 branched-chain amino acid ABC transporter permease [Mesorhizobium sp. YC-39]